ncbi:tyrosine-protein kinase TXK-like isoform X2 [Watersipora subatra]|uniref:tyrosine-protein kinase TXK-like isoform X2 n=1 Tax=Watersipora subatra TaxID=2589382 RepID=UPI00355C7596
MNDDRDGVLIKKEFMVKRSQMKNQIFQFDNFRSRWFQLFTKCLRYYEGSLEKGIGKEKGTRIPLCQVKVVESVDLTVIDQNQGFGFQVWYEEGNTGSGGKKHQKLYISATNEAMRQDWISAIREASLAQGADFSVKFHPSVWTPKSSEFQCCQLANKDAPGCTFPHASALKPVVPGGSNPPSPNPARKSPTHARRVSPQPVIPRTSPTPAPRIDTHASTNPDPPIGELIHLQQSFGPPTSPAPTPPSTLSKKKYVTVLFSYDSQNPEDLTIVKGERLEVVDDEAEQFWWEAKNRKGQIGFIPYNYVAEIKTSEVDLHPWFFPEMSRQRAELLLKEDGREGVFLVRPSNQSNGYTVGIFTKEGRADSGIVKHYHIKLTQRGEYYLSDAHPQPSIPELIAYHSQNAGGLITRLRFHPHEKPAPATVGLSHGMLVIDRKDLQLEKQLGKGNFGEVWRAKYKQEKDVAVKMTLPNLVNDYDFISEAKLMMRLQNEHLVQLYGVCEKPDLLIVTEYMEEGALLDYLKRKKNQLLHQPNTCIEIARQVCEGMAYLESEGFIHRDLAARNCLVGSGIYGYQVKVADFGLSRHVVDDEYLSSVGAKFPIRWSSPEVLLFTKFSSKSDVWAFGVLMWEVFTGGHIPYSNLTANQDVAEHVSQKRKVLNCPHACPSAVYQNIMLKCWQYKDEDRPKFSELRELLSFTWGSS